jgi:hypothetical protein
MVIAMPLLAISSSEAGHSRARPVQMIGLP